MDAAGVPRIADFGLAKFVERDDSLTKTGAAMGSPSYMPPEQAAGHLDQVGPHSDVYSLGAILYELLTGRPPFRAETAVATMRLVMESDPVPPRKLNPAVPPDLETICLKCLEKNPVRRYPSANALAEELGRFLKHEPIRAVPVSAVRKAESWVRRHPWTLMAAGSLVIMVLAGTLYWQYERVKFLERAPMLRDKALRHSGLGKEELGDWFRVTMLTYLINFYVLRVFQQFTQGKKNWMNIWDPSTGFGPKRPVSQRARVISVLLSLAGLGCAAIYFAKIIQASVWLGATSWDEWVMVYPGFYSSLALMSLVVRDYQAFIHGAPSRTLSTEQSELVRQVIFNGDIPGAIKLYRRVIPKVSLEEAVDYVRKLEAELKAKQPEKFAPPEMSGLTWRESVRLRQCAVIVLIVCGVFLNNRVVSGATLLFCAAGFFLGAGMLLSRHLKSFWRQRLARVSMMVCFLMALFAALQFSYKATFFSAEVLSWAHARSCSASHANGANPR
jgi:hypothetical protein